MAKFKINILTPCNYKLFDNEFDATKYGSRFEVYENDYNQDIVWDAVLVYENIKTQVTIKHRKGSLFFCSGEPPLSRVYPQQFVNQFDVFRTTHQHISHPKVVNSHLALNWHFGLSFKSKKQRYTFDDLSKLPYPNKCKLFSVVTSSKKMMPGHNYRQQLISNLKRDFGDYIDFYGDGVNIVDYKCDAILPYMFHICLENSEVKDYWSEKFSDSLLGYAVPIYAGCPNITDFFDERGFCHFKMRDYQMLHDLLKQILIDPKKCYDKMFPYLCTNRDKLLSEYTIYNVIEEMLETSTISETITSSSILPYDRCKNYFIKYKVMQIYRKLLKILINCDLI